jgi:hypothetical protein
MSRRPVESFSGRTICQDCHDRTTGLAAGMLAGGGDVGNAIAVEGWYRRLRARRRARSRPAS